MDASRHSRVDTPDLLPADDFYAADEAGTQPSRRWHESGVENIEVEARRCLQRGDRDRARALFYRSGNLRHQMGHAALSARHLLSAARLEAEPHARAVGACDAARRLAKAARFRQAQDTLLEEYGVALQRCPKSAARLASEAARLSLIEGDVDQARISARRAAALFDLIVLRNELSESTSVSELTARSVRALTD